MRTGVSASRRIARQTSKPSMPGSIRSRITRSGRCFRWSSTAVGPSVATTVA